MKKYIRENYLRIGITLILVLIMVTLFNKESEEMRIESPFSGNSLVGAVEITCTYPLILNSNYQNGIITQEIPPKEISPFIFTFSDFNDEIASLKSIDATQTISDTPIIKIGENEESIFFIEGNGNYYFTLHTIHKKSGISSYQKTVSVFGIPSSSMAMGTCVGY